MATRFTIYMKQKILLLTANLLCTIQAFFNFYLIYLYDISLHHVHGPAVTQKTLFLNLISIILLIVIVQKKILDSSSF